MPIVEDRTPLRFPFPEPPAIGQVTEVAPGILWARIPLPFRLNHVNLYFIADEGGWTVFDTGIYTDDALAAWRQLLDGPLKGTKIARVIVSHAHPDHIGLAGWLTKEFDAPLLISQTSYLVCLNIMLSPGALEARQYQDFYERHGMSQETASVVGSQGHDYLRMVCPLPITFTRLVAGDVLTIGGREFFVHSGDGHSPEQIMLHCPSQNVLLAADQVMVKITPNVSVWAVEPDGDPLGLYLRSLEALSHSIPAEVLVLPGHQLPFYGLRTRCRELIAHHQERCALIEAACAERPCSVADLVPVLFTRELDAHQMGFAFSEAHAHVNYLLRKGRLRHAGTTDGTARVTLA